MTGVEEPVEFVGGPKDGRVTTLPLSVTACVIPGVRLARSFDEMKDAGIPMLSDLSHPIFRDSGIRYVDSGRRTAEGRRVFTLEGGAA